MFCTFVVLFLSSFIGAGGLGFTPHVIIVETGEVKISLVSLIAMCSIQQYIEMIDCFCDCVLEITL